MNKIDQSVNLKDTPFVDAREEHPYPLADPPIGYIEAESGRELERALREVLACWEMAEGLDMSDVPAWKRLANAARSKAKKLLTEQP